MKPLKGTMKTGVPPTKAFSSDPGIGKRKQGRNHSGNKASYTEVDQLPTPPHGSEFLGDGYSENSIWVKENVYLRGKRGEVWKAVTADPGGFSLSSMSEIRPKNSLSGGNKGRNPWRYLHRLYQENSLNSVRTLHVTSAA